MQKTDNAKNCKNYQSHKSIWWCISQYGNYEPGDSLIYKYVKAVLHLKYLISFYNEFYISHQLTHKLKAYLPRQSRYKKYYLNFKAAIT